jgi:hypothetical protein
MSMGEDIEAMAETGCSMVNIVFVIVAIGSVMIIGACIEVGVLEWLGVNFNNF